MATTTHTTINEARQANYKQAAQDYAKGATGATRYIIAQNAETGEYLAGGIFQTHRDDGELAKKLAENGNELIEITAEAPITLNRTLREAKLDEWYETKIKPHIAAPEAPEYDTSETCRHGVPLGDDCAECDADWE